MSRFLTLSRALLVALGLSLLAEGLPALPGGLAVASDDLAAELELVLPEDVSAYTCESGFDDIDSRLGMSLHGVTQLESGAVAVGYSRRRDAASFGRRAPATLVNRGGEWTRVETGSPGNEDGLMAVASGEGGRTWAVGWTTIDGRVMPLAMRWTGRGWKVDRPRQRGRLTSVFTDVTILANGRPLAVGYRMTASGRRQPVVSRRDKPRWRSIPLRVSARESVTLTGVATDGRGGVWAVGHGGPGAEIRPLIFRRGDGAWSRTPTPRLKGEAVLSDVVALSRGDAWAVGYHRHDGISEPLVLRWNGRTWRTLAGPVFGSRDVLLHAISADPAGGVWVVGAAWDDELRSHEAVAAWWDGQAWNEYAGRAGGTELHDVVGSLDEDGWAVGRAGQSARATRVCAPLRSGVFGGSLPDTVEAPDVGSPAVAGAPEQSGSSRAAGTESTGPAAAAATSAPGRGAKASRSSKARKASKARKGAAYWRGARTRRSRRNRMQTLPAPRADRAILARDVAREAGLFEETATYNAVVADFDGDGVDDLFIGRHGSPGRLLLNRAGVFVDHQPLEQPSIDRHGCTAADIDGSGLPDLYCAVGGKRGSGLKSNELWLDPGGPAPLEVAVERGVSDPTGRGRLTAFLEAAAEPDVSLVVTNSPARVDGLPSVGRRFTTAGDGQLTAKARPGFEPRLGAVALSDADYDGDGREDLLLVTGGPQAPERGGTRLYRNTRRGLVDMTRRLGIAPFDAVDAELVDVNGDGRLDLVQLSATRLRVSVRQGATFRKVYERRLRHGRAIASGDVNGDGLGDLYLVRSNGGRNYRDVLLLNRTGGRAWSSLVIPSTSSGSGEDAYAIDHDGNGLDDFLVLNGHNGRGPTQLIAFYPR